MGIYEKNIEALRKRNPGMAELIESVEINEDEIKLVRTESGDYRVLYRIENGEYTFINGDDNAQERANEAVGQFCGLGKEGVVILFGFEFGYLAEEILKKLGKDFVLFVYEAVPEIFKKAIMTRDISGLLASERVNIVFGEDVEDFSVFHAIYGRINNGMFFVIKDHLSVRLNNDTYERFYKRLKEEKRLVDSCTATLLQLSKEFVNTFLSNIPFILRNPGVNKLKDIFKDRPAIIVSAGPSIDKNLHLLRNAKGKAVIIAVDAVVPTLLPCGIIPDIIVGIDPLECNIPMFKDNPLLSDVPFVCIGQYTSEIVRLYPGPLFVSNSENNIVYNWLKNFLEDKGAIGCFGGSVAHFAFSVAEFMGCGVIAFVGQDLSYNEYVHSKGFRDATNAEPANHANSVQIQNIFCETAHTNASFIAFKISFENAIKKFKGKVINATEDGLPIDGAIPMRFIDFIDEYCRGLSEIDTFSILSGFSDDIDSDKLDGIITKLIEGRGTFNDIKKTSLSILGCVESVKKLIKYGKQESKRFRNVLNNMDVLVEQAKHPLFGLLQSYHLELFMKKESLRGIDETKDRWEQLDKKLELATIHYSQAVVAIDLLSDRISRLITILQMEKNVGTILADELLDQKEKSLKAGMMYMKEGVIREAVKHLESVVSEQEAASREQLEVASGTDGATCNTEIYVSLAEMYVQQFRFYEAKELLENVTDYGVQGMDSVISDEQPVTCNAQFTTRVKELLKTCDEKINVWNERKKDMKKLVNDAEADYGGHLESGNFYFRVKDYERAEKAFSEAISEQLAVGNDSLLLTAGVQSKAESSQSSTINASYYGLASAYKAMGKPEKSEHTLEKVIEIESVNTGLYCHSK
ncbi:MAG: 6-hydroxymethylpterin diphosphokinase MptE-like protein [Candidatus Anammoxibacter sp.]